MPLMDFVFLSVVYQFTHRLPTQKSKRLIPPIGSEFAPQFTSRWGSYPGFV